jgi:hypothetical protein
LINRYVPAGNYDEKHRQDLAVAQIYLEQSADHDPDHGSDSCIQQETFITSFGHKPRERAMKVTYDEQQHPDHHQEGRDASFRCVLKVEIVKVLVETRRQRARFVGGQVIQKLILRFIESDPEQRVSFNHPNSGSDADQPEFI